MSTNLVAFVVVLGVLIFFHELGHFLVARLFGVGVERFSLGFGPRIFGKQVGITDYRVSAIPLGGYVKMVGEEPDAEIDPADIPISFTQDTPGPMCRRDDCACERTSRALGLRPGACGLETVPGSSSSRR